MIIVWELDRLWTQQTGGCTGILRGSPAHLVTTGNQALGINVARCSSARKSGLSLPGKFVGGEGFPNDGRRQEQEQEQELLWQEFFVDSRLDNRSSRSPDFRRKGSGDGVLRLDNMLKPARVDEQLICWDRQLGRGASSSSQSSSPKKPGPGWRRGPAVGVVTAETVSTLCEHGKLTEAVEALQALALTDCPLPPSLIYAVLKLCTVEKDLVVGQRVHELTVKLGYESNAFLGNHLVRMYAAGGRLQKAMDVFTRVGKPDAFMWSSIISAYAKHGKPHEAIELYHEMRRLGVKADAHVFAAALQACALAADLESGMKLHRDVLHSGIPLDLFLGTCVVDMYAKCDKLEDARRVFDSLGTKNVVTWTALITGYAKSGDVEVARQIFDGLATKSVVTWNALIAGYTQQGHGQEALVLYGEMEREGQIVADYVTFACLLQACGSTGALQQGRQLHSQIVERGLLHTKLLGNCLVDMYAKCGELEDARRVFDSLVTKDVVTWTALIGGYTQQGLAHEALLLYEQMEQEGLVVADHVTLAFLLKACASAGALQKGRQLHFQIGKKGLLDDILVGTCLVDMYAKCGELKDARAVFDSLVTKDVVTWTSLISGYGSCDEGHKALACFEEMLVAGIQPDDATFTCLLVACSHEGLVHEGRKHFESMAAQHGINPTLEHHNCMVDLLGRAGHLDEAEDMLLSCESQSNAVGWTSLLSASTSHSDVDRAARCFERLVALDPQQAPAYVLMANAYADAGRWTDVERIEALRMGAGASKKPAVAGIEVKEQVHTFVVGERTDAIALKVVSTSARLKEEGGHVPQTRLVLKPLSENEKEDVLCGHAEKLALAFGLLNTPNGAPLVVTKNLRMCSDCHSSTEIMSRLEKRDIVVRDGYRVHRFTSGCCSCQGRP